MNEAEKQKDFFRLRKFSKNSISHVLGCLYPSLYLIYHLPNSENFLRDVIVIIIVTIFFQFHFLCFSVFTRFSSIFSFCCRKNVFFFVNISMKASLRSFTFHPKSFFLSSRKILRLILCELLYLFSR